MKKGALVAHAEGAREQTLLASTRGRVAASEAQAKQTQSDLDRLSALGSDPQSLAHARDALRTAQAAAAASQSELRARTAELEGTRVVAPFDAVVAETVIENGDLVPPTAALVELIDDSHFTVRAAYAETDAARIRPDQEAQVAFAGVAEAQPGRVAHGDVVRLRPGAVSVDVDLAGTGSARGRRRGRRHAGGRKTPCSSLLHARRDAAGSKVMVLDGKGRGSGAVETGLTGGSAVRARRPLRRRRRARRAGRRSTSRASLPGAVTAPLARRTRLAVGRQASATSSTSTSAFFGRVTTLASATRAGSWAAATPPPW